ncbi:MAG: 50S ribosomal protein L23 [Burkholderiales bacterium]
MEARDIIIKPILTEKSYDDLAAKKYTFMVDIRANKTEVKKAVEEIFGVKVSKVNTLRQMGKVKRQGYTSGRRPEYKKAFVTLTKDSKTIEFFDSLSQ